MWFQDVFLPKSWALTGLIMQLARPFWIDNPDRKQPLTALGGVVVLSLMTTGVSVVFSFLGRDFFNALSSKNEVEFYQQLVKYLCGFAVGIPVFVFRDYFLVCPLSKAGFTAPLPHCPTAGIVTAAVARIGPPNSSLHS